MLTKYLLGVGKPLKILLVFAIVLATCLAFAALTSARMYGNPPTQETVIPSCSFKIDRSSEGVPIKEMPRTLANGSWLYVKCGITEGLQQNWAWRTELIDADWKVNGNLAATGKELLVTDYHSPGEELRIELEGFVPQNRVRVSITDDKDHNGQDSPYLIETSPPREVLVIHLSDDTQDVKYKENVIAVHPLTDEVDKRIKELKKAPNPYIEHIVTRAEELSQTEGRPWVALDLLDSVQPLKKTLASKDSSINSWSFGAGALGLVALGLLLLLLAVIFFYEKLTFLPNHVSKRNDDPYDAGLD